MARRRGLQIFLILLAAVLLGTLAVLSTISFYLAIDSSAYITEDEVGPMENGTRWNATEHGLVERIPRIIHQTWKTDILPERWTAISQECRDMMSDYEYMLWTDASSRDFIVEKYPWFLDTFDSYIYPIQRADAIRYFVLHHYGGVYLDLDVGCLRPLDRLLTYQIILPKTIPVGVSNDLMFAEKEHPFMTQTIHSLITFDHSWVLNYPTVMFSTGPMFLSAQYGIWSSSSHAPAGQVRILPKALYGKNAKVGEAPHAFFSHFYGSSWHADDAAFIGFLGKWGKGLMWVGLVILVIGVGRLVWQRQFAKKRGEGIRHRGGYEVLMPRSHGRWSVVPGLFALILPSSSSTSTSTSPIDSPTLPEEDNENMPMLPFTIDMRPSSPDLSSEESGIAPGRRPASGSPTLDAIYRAGNRVLSSIVGVSSSDRGRDRQRTRPPSSPLSPSRRNTRHNRGMLFFLPAILTPGGSSPHPDDHPSSASRRGSPLARSFSRAHSAAPPRASSSSAYPIDKPQAQRRYTDDDLESASLHGYGRGLGHEHAGHGRGHRRGASSSTPLGESTSRSSQHRTSSSISPRSTSPALRAAVNAAVIRVGATTTAEVPAMSPPPYNATATASTGRIITDNLGNIGGAAPGTPWMGERAWEEWESR